MYSLRSSALRFHRSQSIRISQINKVIQSRANMSTEKTISDLAKAETATNGQGPEAGGAAANAQSQLAKERNLDAKVEELETKSPQDITQKDAKETQALQDRLFGHDAKTSDSLAAKVQSQADKNANN